MVQENDVIEIDVPNRRLNIIGVNKQELPIEDVNKILEERRKNFVPKKPKYNKGVLRLFREHAASPMKGAYLEYDD